VSPNPRKCLLLPFNNCGSLLKLDWIRLSLRAFSLLEVVGGTASSCRSWHVLSRETCFAFRMSHKMASNQSSPLPLESLLSSFVIKWYIHTCYLNSRMYRHMFLLIVALSLLTRSDAQQWSCPVKYGPGTKPLLFGGVAGRCQAGCHRINSYWTDACQFKQGETWGSCSSQQAGKVLGKASTS
jgi:hypothetical protein